MMKSEKNEALQIIAEMPGKCTTTDITAELYFKQKVEAGLRDLKNKRIISQKEVRQRMAQCLH